MEQFNFPHGFLSCLSQQDFQFSAKLLLIFYHRNKLNEISDKIPNLSQHFYSPTGSAGVLSDQSERKLKLRSQRYMHKMMRSQVFCYFN